MWIREFRLLWKRCRKYYYCLGMDVNVYTLVVVLNGAEWIGLRHDMTRYGILGADMLMQFETFVRDE